METSKSASWRFAASLLETAAEAAKTTTHYGSNSEAPECEHILAVIVPFLRNKARHLERLRAGQAMTAPSDCTVADLEKAQNVVNESANYDTNCRQLINDVATAIAEARAEAFEMAAMKVEWANLDWADGDPRHVIATAIRALAAKGGA